MNDPQAKEFRHRLKRIDRIHRRGGGFEASGTLGQSYYTRIRRRAGRPVLRPALIILFSVILFKAVSAASLGETGYEARVQALHAGSVGEQVVGFIMAPDPVSRALSQVIAPFFG